MRAKNKALLSKSEMMAIRKGVTVVNREGKVTKPPGELKQPTPQQKKKPLKQTPKQAQPQSAQDSFVKNDL